MTLPFSSDARCFYSNKGFREAQEMKWVGYRLF